MSQKSVSSPRRRRPWRITALVVAVALVVGGGASAAYAFSVGGEWDSKTVKLANAFPAADVRPAIASVVGDDAAATAQNILILGSDTRGEHDASIDSLEGQRSDTIMVVHLPADRKNPTVMSIMRDSWVTIPGHGEGKINAALSYGGVPLAVQAIEGLIGVRIDHVAVVDFAGFKGVTDALGGVDVYNSKPFESSKLKGHVFEHGMLAMNGEEALAYVRERYAFTDGDFQRARNQQQFAAGLLSKVLNPGTLTNPGRIGGLVSAVAPYLAVDDGFTSSYVAELALELRGVTPSDVAFFTAPTAGTGTSADGQSIVNVDWAQFDVVKQAFEADSLDAYAASVSR